jgi:hypothetical protein
VFVKLRGGSDGMGGGRDPERRCERPIWLWNVRSRAPALHTILQRPVKGPRRCRAAGTGSVATLPRRIVPARPA